MHPRAPDFLGTFQHQQLKVVERGEAVFVTDNFPLRQFFQFDRTINPWLVGTTPAAGSAYAPRRRNA
jgi:hypothetical protein